MQEVSPAERAVATALEALEAGEYPEPPAEIATRARAFLGELEAALATCDGEATLAAAKDLVAAAAVICSKVGADYAAPRPTLEWL